MNDAPGEVNVRVRLVKGLARRQAKGGTIQGMKPTVFVDGNNVMGSRADGWWRDRADATQRLVAEIASLARRSGGIWTIVFDGPRPHGMTLPQKCLAVIHTGHGRRDGADDRIVELVGSLPDGATVLVYTSDAELRTRAHALGAQVEGAQSLLKEIAVARDTKGPSGSGDMRPKLPISRDLGR